MAHLVALPDVDASSGRFVKNAASLSLGLIRSSERNDELHSGNSDRPDRGSLDHEARAAQNAIDFAKSSEAIAVVFSNRVRFFNRNVIHDGCPEPEAARGYQNTSSLNLNHNSLNYSNNRFRVASCTKSTQLDRDTNTSAARHEGLSHLTALVHAPGARRNSTSWMPYGIDASPLARRRAKKSRALHLNPRRNQRSPKYVSAINTIDAPAIHHMRTAFWFVLQSSYSDSQSRRSAAATACAISSSTRRTPASVPDRALVVGQQ